MKEIMMKKYYTPFVEVAHINAMSMVMDSPGADIQSSANNVGLNQPGGKGAPAHSKVY